MSILCDIETHQLLGWRSVGHLHFTGYRYARVSVPLLMVVPMKNEIERFLKNFKMRTTNEDGAYYLLIDEFRKIPWRPPLKKRLFSSKPNIEFYEETSTGIVSYLLQNYDIRTFIDAGASSGYFSQLCLSFKKRPVNAYAFEMQPNMLPALQKSLEQAAIEGCKGEAICAGLSNVDKGRTKIWYSVTRLYETRPEEKDYRNSWWRQLKFALRGRKNRDELKEAEIEITTVDAFVTKSGTTPDLIKVDVDGHEGLLLQGARETLRKHKPIVLLELHKDKLLRKTGMDRPGAVSELFDAGYEGFMIDDHHDLHTGIIEVDRNSALLSRQSTDMFLFWHPQSFERIAKV